MLLLTGHSFQHFVGFAVCCSSCSCSWLLFTQIVLSNTSLPQRSTGIALCMLLQNILSTHFPGTINCLGYCRYSRTRQVPKVYCGNVVQASYTSTSTGPPQGHIVACCWCAPNFRYSNLSTGYELGCHPQRYPLQDALNAAGSLSVHHSGFQMLGIHNEPL